MGDWEKGDGCYRGSRGVEGKENSVTSELWTEWLEKESNVSARDGW
ncbi:MAG: hypothetical protein Q9M37_09325 [Desulfonauticus sp.]|nr:hypothetical protein [Desulfonauticus sp.]